MREARMLEVCVDTIQAAIEAQAAGASRLELCSALDVGGVTPCGQFIEVVRQQVTCPLVVLIRPRTGGFVYNAAGNQVIDRFDSLWPSMQALMVWW